MHYLFIRSLGEELQRIRTDILKTERKWNISIRRNKIWENVLELLSDADDKDLMSELIVKFIGEEGLDAGGLRREMFSLVFQKTPLIEGNTFSNTSSSLHSKEYFQLGKLVSLSLVYGHSGFQKLHPVITKYIISEEMPSSEIDINSIHSDALKQTIEEV